MTISYFSTRVDAEVRTRDEFCIYAQLDELRPLSNAWSQASGASAHVYKVQLPEGYYALFARGNKLEKQFAVGFLNGWKASRQGAY